MWGGEAIEWRVLAVEDGRALLLTDWAVDAEPYNREWNGFDWAHCTLRRWLNGAFLWDAFSATERAVIAEAPAANDDSSGWDVPGESAARDRVFCLSTDDALRYFADDDARVCRPTRRARFRGAYVSNSGTCGWWLRFPGDGLVGGAPVVDPNGVIRMADYSAVHDGYTGVRPAIWLNL